MIFFIEIMNILYFVSLPAGELRVEWEERSGKEILPILLAARSGRRLAANTLLYEYYMALGNTFSTSQIKNILTYED